MCLCVVVGMGAWVLDVFVCRVHRWVSVSSWLVALVLGALVGLVSVARP